MIIIVGSGIAGISAAVKLSKAGKKVLVLQANSYPGGRMHTNKITLSSGASWIHGSGQQSPLTALCDKMGLSRVQTKNDLIVTYDMQKNQRDKQTYAVFEQYEMLIKQSQQYKGTQKSYYNFIKEQNDKLLQNPYFMHTISNDIQFQTSADIKDLGVTNAFNDDNYQGIQELVVSGYQSLVQKLIQSKKLTVKLNSKVISIKNKGPASEVLIQGGEVLIAQKVIIAVPMGVLKKKQIKFEPELPKQKQSAIEKAGFGNVCKILLDFKQKLWNLEQHYISIIQKDIEKRGQCTFFLNLVPLTDKPLIMTFGLGKNSDQIQKMSQPDLKRLISTRLSVFCTRQVKPQDFKIYRSNWRSNSNFSGTFTYAPTGFMFQQWKILSKPVFQNGWFFAGQHCTFRYRGSVHGACMSGQVAADDVLKNKTKDNWKYMDQEWWNDQNGLSQQKKQDQQEQQLNEQDLMQEEQGKEDQIEDEEKGEENDIKGQEQVGDGEDEGEDEGDDGEVEEQEVLDEEQSKIVQNQE